MKTSIGHDSHRFDPENKEKPLKLGGVVFENHMPLAGNSDADVVLHALTNAVSGITCVNILGEIADRLCLDQGITDSAIYLKESLKYLEGQKIVHISISIECKTPKITPLISKMRYSISEIIGVNESSIGITATSGEELTAFGRGEGIQVFCIITVD